MFKIISTNTHFRELPSQHTAQQIECPITAVMTSDYTIANCGQAIDNRFYNRLRLEQERPRCPFCRDPIPPIAFVSFLSRKKRYRLF